MDTLHRRPDVFGGALEVDIFWECFFADPSSRFVCFESEFIGCDAAATSARPLCDLQ
jgi:hypothetical protein